MYLWGFTIVFDDSGIENLIFRQFLLTNSKKEKSKTIGIYNFKHINNNCQIQLMIFLQIQVRENCNLQFYNLKNQLPKTIDDCFWQIQILETWKTKSWFTILKTSKPS